MIDDDVHEVGGVSYELDDPSRVGTLRDGVLQYVGSAHGVEESFE